ncbi:MAG: 4-hydroxy-tetrahydrodipicolinate reductase [Dehalococcoidales bacterium]|nr:4-hydroxy-tetrahydrodipicolinate reductase [Dehalococcoidales bacterium]
MKPISVVVHGASGKMGMEVVKAVSREPGMRVVGAVDQNPAEDTLTIPGSLERVPFSSDIDQILSGTKPDVMVDFSVAAATKAAVPVAARQGLNLVIGTTGFSPADLDEMSRLAKQYKIGIVVAANFALGAVLMMHLSKIAAKYFDFAEIVELHHDQKVDFPSGTALATAKAMVKSKGKPFSMPAAEQGTVSSRGKQIDGITIHSVRLPGLVANQEVIFGMAGQTLRIKHDTINRECFMPGVILAVKEVLKRPGLTVGLEALLNLQEA